MKIDYDKDFEKVMTELQANFGWSNIELLPDSHKDLINDTIKAVKNCSIHNIVELSEQLPQNFCTLNQQNCGKGHACKYPHCHL